MKQISNILVPTDFSELDNNAIETAVSMALRHQAVLHLLHITGIGSTAEAGKRLQQIVKNLRAKYGIRAEWLQKKGRLEDVVKALTRKGIIDIVVMGTTGAAGFREFLGGSRALNMIRMSEVPLLSIPRSSQTRSFRRILFPIRVSKEFLDKYHFVESIIEKNGSELVIAGLTGPGEKYNLGPDDEKILALGESLRSKGVRFHTVHYQTENKGKKLLELASEFSADLIVINASLEYKWRQEFITTYTQYVVDQSPVPVLSIRDQEPEMNFDEKLKAEIRNAYQPALETSAFFAD